MRMFARRTSRFAYLAGAMLCATTLACANERQPPVPPAVTLTGAGATFPYPLYRAWFSEYAAQTGVRMNYYSVGSAEGLRLLEQGDVDFGATDRRILPPTAMRATPCARVAVSMVVGTIAVVYNLPSLAAAEPLRFDAALLADIFAGRITRWSDARISAHNGGGALPDIAVTVVHRGSGSGTGQAFAAFLSTSDRWPRIDDTTDVRRPVGTPVEGNEGMAVEVKVTAGAIGYVELAHARQPSCRGSAARTIWIRRAGRRLGGLPDFRSHLARRRSGAHTCGARPSACGVCTSGRFEAAHSRHDCSSIRQSPRTPWRTTTRCSARFPSNPAAPR